MVLVVVVPRGVVVGVVKVVVERSSCNGCVREKRNRRPFLRELLLVVVVVVVVVVGAVLLLATELAEVVLFVVVARVAARGTVVGGEGGAGRRDAEWDCCETPVERSKEAPQDDVAASWLLLLLLWLSEGRGVVFWFCWCFGSAVKVVSTMRGVVIKG